MRRLTQRNMHRYCWRGLWFIDIRYNDVDYWIKTGYDFNVNDLLK